jgi:hypothetical protein
MTNLELSTNELLMLKEIIETDMEMGSWGEGNYDDVALMQYYLDRATMLVKVRDMLSERS